MNQVELLDIVAAVLRSAEHPEVTEVGRFEGDQHGAPPGVRVTFENGSRDYMMLFPPGGWKAGRS